MITFLDTINNKRREKEILYEKENKQNNEENINYDAAMKNKIKENANKFINSIDNEISLLKALDVEDSELNVLLSKIKDKSEEKEKLYEQENIKHNEENINYDPAMKNEIIENAIKLVESIDNEMSLLKSLDVEDSELNVLLSKIKDKREEKRNYIKKN